MHFSFCSINPWQRWHNSWRNLKSIILHCQCLHRCFEPEKVNWPWSSCENSFLVLCNAIYCSAFCSQGSTSASGQDFLCRHWNSLTLERLHGGGCGGWGESSQRDSSCHWEDSRRWNLAARTRIFGCPCTTHYQYLPGETPAFCTRPAKAVWIDHHLVSNSSWFPGPQKGPVCTFLKMGFRATSTSFSFSVSQRLDKGVEIKKKKSYKEKIEWESPVICSPFWLISNFPALWVFRTDTQAFPCYLTTYLPHVHRVFQNPTTLCLSFFWCVMSSPMSSYLPLYLESCLVRTGSH